MKCENCPTRACLDNGGFCDQGNSSTDRGQRVGPRHSSPPEWWTQPEDNSLQQSVDFINELSERNREYHRRQRISDQVQECIRRDHPAFTCSRAVPPTAKQQNLVQEYLRFNRWVKHPPFTKQGYFVFIRDVVMKDIEFQTERSCQSGLDEDWIMEFCQNDVWCEEY